MKKKPCVIVLGPVTSNGGIASVINSITKEEALTDHYRIVKINTSQYKDSGLSGELITVILGLIKYLYTIIFCNPKIIHIHTSAKISFFRKSIFGIIGSLCKKKIIYHIHSSDFYNFFYNPQKELIRKLIAFVFKRADKIVCLCDDWQKCLKEKYHLTNTVVITNPVTLGSFKKQAGANNTPIQKILFMGFYIESKGIVDLLEAFQKVLKKIDYIELYLCGKGELNQYINNFIDSNNLSSKIINVGWVAGERKDDAFNNADIFILPSYKEGVPIAILEAYSHGLPVISTKISGIPDILKNYYNGFLIEPGDKGELCNKIEELVSKPDLIEKMGLNNLEQIKHHHPDKIAMKWVNLYNSLINIT